MTEFEMTEADLLELLDACKSVPAIALNCGSMPNQQQRVNAVWEKLGQKMGFDSSTVRPSRHGQERFFWAKPFAAGDHRETGMNADQMFGDFDPRPAQIIRSAIPCPLAQNLAVRVMEHTRDKDRQLELLRQVAADLKLAVRIEKVLP